jgi:hypothetical protein
MTPRTTLRLLAAAAAAGVAVLYTFFPADLQPKDYLPFADARTLLGIPNALDVLSNLPFLVVGILGLAACARARTGDDAPFRTPWERGAFTFLFASIGAVAFGSSWFHLHPDDARLFWDRLPMTLAFMGLFGIVIAERVGVDAGRRLLPPLVLAGAGTALYWKAAGDLRPYVMVQFFPLLAIPFLLLSRPAAYTGSAELWIMIGLYAAAKGLESADRAIYGWGGLVSGHTLKHLAAAAACARLLSWIRRRRPAPGTSPAASHSPR